MLEWENAVAAGEGLELPHPDVGVPPPNTPGVERSTPFHSRADWGARPPRYTTPIPRPEGLTLHYGGPSPWSGVDRSSTAAFLRTASHDRCATIMRAYQRYHMDNRGWADFAYSSGACPHGHRYEGRGKDVRTAAQGTTAGNDASHATCYIAGEGDPLTPEAKAAFRDESLRLRGLRKGHRDWKSTACPGTELYRWVHSAQTVPGGTTPPPPPPTSEDDKVYVFARDSADRLWLIDGQTRRRVVGQADAAYVRRFFKPIQENGRAFTSLPDAWIHSHPDVGVLASTALYARAGLEVGTRIEEAVAELEAELDALDDADATV